MMPTNYRFSDQAFLVGAPVDDQQWWTSFGDPVAADSAVSSGLVLRFISLRNADIRAVLRTIASRSKVRVLSTPELLAMNNREARVLVGSRVPFVASTRLGNDVAIENMHPVKRYIQQGIDTVLGQLKLQ